MINENLLTYSVGIPHDPGFNFIIIIFYMNQKFFESDRYFTLFKNFTSHKFSKILPVFLPTSTENRSRTFYSSSSGFLLLPPTHHEISFHPCTFVSVPQYFHSPYKTYVVSSKPISYSTPSLLTFVLISRLTPFHLSTATSYLSVRSQKLRIGHSSRLVVVTNNFSHCTLLLSPLYSSIESVVTHTSERLFSAFLSSILE